MTKLAQITSTVPAYIEWGAALSNMAKSKMLCRSSCPQSTFANFSSEHLNGDFLVTDLHRSVMVAEHSRTPFKLSEALYQDPGSEKASIKMRDEAERL